MTDKPKNGSQSENAAEGAEGDSRRPYVVLEQRALIDVIGDLLRKADVSLTDEQLIALEDAWTGDERPGVYVEVGRYPSRNAEHALRQSAGNFTEGVTSPLVAVSERMFKPRPLTIKNNPSVSMGR